MKGRERGLGQRKQEVLSRSRPGTLARGDRLSLARMAALSARRAQWELGWGPGYEVLWSTFALYPEDSGKLLTVWERSG